MGTSSPRAELRQLASTQHGLFATWQAQELGLTRHLLNAWSRSGEIASFSRSVWQICGSPTTELQTAMGCVLAGGPGTVLALQSAMGIWEVPGFSVLPAEVLRIRTRHRSEGAPHTSTRLHGGHVTDLHGIPLTTPTRTLFDLARRLHPERLAIVLDRLIARRLTTIALLDQMMFDLQGRGRAGVVLLRELIDERRDPQFHPTESGLEFRVQKVLADAGLTGFQRQVVIGDDEGVVGRVDFVHLLDRIILEVQSELYHRSLTDRERDAIRMARLRSARWLVIEIPEAWVWNRPALVVAAVREARRARARSA